MIFHRMTVGELFTNCYVAACEDTNEAILFDAPDNTEKILGFLNKKNLKLKYVFLTHAHFDHILALAEIKAATGCKIAIHEAEVKYLNDPSLNLSNSMLGMVLPEITADIIFKDDDVFDFNGKPISVIHTPGHTEGSVCYLLENILVSGDTLFNKSIGRSDFPFGDYDTEINSIQKKLMVLDDEIKVYPGHGFSTSIGKERKENPYLL